MDVASTLPFSGPVQLFTKMQALKLFWFIRDSIGRHNIFSLKNGQIQGIVAKVIASYWGMAGYETIDPSPATRQVKRIVDDYQRLLKLPFRFEKLPGIWRLWIEGITPD